MGVGKGVRFVAGAVALSAVFLMSVGPSSAKEAPGGGVRTEPYVNGPSSPVVLILGDSISQSQEQKDNYAYINAVVKNWGTEVRATGGYTISDHLASDPSLRKTNTFKYAHDNANVRAVFVELGTNDMAGVTTEAERTKVWNAVEKAVSFVPNKCIVWLGLNTQFNGYVTHDQAANFNSFIFQNSKEQGGKFSNVHFGDYNSLVKNNADVNAALRADTTNKVHFIGEHAPAARTALANFEESLVDRYCL